MTPIPTPPPGPPIPSGRDPLDAEGGRKAPDTAGRRGTSDAAGRREAPDAAARREEPDAGSRRLELGRRQAGLVAALVAGGEVPAGFDAGLVGVARRALLRKRAGEVAGAWPVLVASIGPQWMVVFAGWADGRPARGALRDGWDFARHLVGTGGLPATAEAELAVREATWRYDGVAAPRRRRLPALRRVGGTTVLGVAGRCWPLTTRGRAGIANGRPDTSRG
jgi:hypothetical protein